MNCVFSFVPAIAIASVLLVFQGAVSAPPAQAPPAQEPAAGTVKKNAKGLEFVYVPAGEFTMGGAAAGFEKQAVRKVTLDGYWIEKNLVTVAQFYDYCQASGYKFDWDGRRPDWGWDADDRPMVNVTSTEARAYCRWVGGDLPTEAQWEKAARGTDGRFYPWGNDWQAGCSWTSQDGGDKVEPAPVGSFPKGASPYGCLDMLGNVFQWCLDWYADIDTTATINPKGPAFGTGRVLKGICYRNTKYPIYTRSSGKSSFFFDKESGFRCVMAKL